MSQLVTFRNFKDVALLRSRFARRGEMVAWDANLHDNAIRPFRCPEVLCEGVHHESLYSQPECLCAGDISHVHSVQGFVETQHFTITVGMLYQRNKQDICGDRFGCLAGAPLPSRISAVGGSCGCDGVQFYYVATFVTEHEGVQVESAPSEPSVGVVGDPLSPNISLLLPSPHSAYCIARIRVYRTEASFQDAESGMPLEGAEFALVADLPADVSEHTDALPTCDTGYPLTTHDPMPFPAPQDISFLTRTEDGIAVADENRVYISVAGQPMFTTDGIVNIEDKIRCIRAIGNTLFVLTDKFPVKIQYSITEGMLSIKRETLQKNLPLTSYKSVSVYGDTLFFASEFSLYSWNTSGYGGDARSVLNRLMTPHQWKMLDPTSVVGVAYEYGYMLSSPSLGHSIMFEFEGESDTRVATHLMPISYINASAMGLTHDGRILFVQDGNVNIWDFREQVFCDDLDIQDSDERNMCEECCPYRMRFFYNNTSKNTLRVARIEFDERSAEKVFTEFRLEHFGGTEHTENIEVLSSRAFNVPRFVSSQAFSIEVSGCATITEIRLATAFADLSNSGSNTIGNSDNDGQF